MKFFKRILAVIPAFLLQILWYYTITRWLAPFQSIIAVLLSALAVIFVVVIISNRDESTYKMLWLIIILAYPIIGAIMYALFGNQRTGRGLRRKLENAEKIIHAGQMSDEPAMSEVRAHNNRMAETFSYIEKESGFPLTPIKEATYFKIGEEMFADMLVALSQAKQYIYMEYFIIENGEMFDSMLAIIEDKIKEGVKVRLMYDDLGSIATFSKGDLDKLKKKGIEIVRFNRMVFVKGTLNYRDHRKMLIIDGKIAYSGGINLADEYINKKERFGHWKDIGFSVTGRAVESFLIMFTQFWDAFAPHPIPKEEYAYREDRREYEYLMDTFSQDAVLMDMEEATLNSSFNNKGYVLSYYDSPLRKETISNDLFIELLNSAEKYAYFYTPYLMLGDLLLNTMIMAAKRGVDVRIIVPHIPDKKIIFRMTRSYYAELIAAGVKIYEYTPGFIHAKASVFDDRICTVGTVNLDFRSLFLHFENNSVFYRAELIKDLKADFDKTVLISEEITKDKLKKGIIKRFIDGICHIVAPLC